MDNQLEQLWGLASALRAEMAGSRLGFRLEELLAELEECAAAEMLVAIQ